MNRWNIPRWLEQEVRNRDIDCVYCGVRMTRGVRGASIRTAASWEHIVNDIGIVTRENIVLCCVSCNASKGTRLLSEWLLSAYCKNKGITAQSVAPVVQAVLEAAVPSEPNNALQATREDARA